MPRGGRRPGSGRKPLPLEQLQLTGQFRRSRHAHLLQAVAPQNAGSSALAFNRDEQPIPKIVLTGLRAPGRQFVADVWKEFERWGAAELRLLRQAARTCDDFEAAADARDRRLAARVFQALVHQLGLVERK